MDRRYDEKDVTKVYKLTSAWDDRAADRMFTLTTLVEFKNGERQISDQAHGDYEWSKRIEKHYNIKTEEK